MGIESYITDPLNHKNAHIDITPNEKQALIVATRPLKTFEHAIKFFTNPIFGSNANIAVTFGGSPEIIYAENAEWTSSAISGTWDFASTDFAQAGSVSVDATATTSNNVSQFDKGSDLDLSNFISITGYIYITRWDATGIRGVNIVGWNTGISSPVGISVGIENYIDVSILNIWQQFAIPLSDMKLAGEIIDSIRVTTIHTGGAQPPNYYLDTIEIEQKGTLDPQMFAVTPDSGTWLHVIDFTIFIADDSYDPSFGSSMLKIPYKTLLGESLSIGLLYQGRRGDNRGNDHYC